MVAVTYGTARVAAGEGAPRMGFFARLVEAMAESRMQQTRRAIRMHTQLSPKPQAEELPFGGW